MQITETPDTAFEDIHRLHELYRAGFHGDFLNRSLRKIIEQQISQDTSHLEQVTDELNEFENQYHMPSDEFWSRYQSGAMADTADFMEWNILCKMRQRILARLTILQGQQLL